MSIIRECRGGPIQRGGGVLVGGVEGDSGELTMGGDSDVDAIAIAVAGDMVADESLGGVDGGSSELGVGLGVKPVRLPMRMAERDSGGGEVAWRFIGDVGSKVPLAERDIGAEGRGVRVYGGSKIACS
jgi:hypothetical protein